MGHSKVFLTEVSVFQECSLRGVPLYILSLLHAHIHAHVHTQTNTHTYNMHVHIHTRAHTHTLTHTHTAKELKRIDVTDYFPKKLNNHHVHNLCHAIFNSGVRVKHSLRRGIWMHIVGVYHPDMTTHDQRELYLARLRRIYDSLKGKWQGDMSSQVSQRRYVSITC